MATYWNSKGAHQKDYERIFEKYVPKRGHCCNDVFELFRAVSTAYYRYFNDGDMPIVFWEDYRKVFRFDNKAYEEMLDRLFREIVGDDDADEIASDEIAERLEVLMDAAVVFAGMSEAQGDITLPAEKYLELI